MEKPAEVISHWHQSIEYLETSAMEFYTSIEMAIKARQVEVEVTRFIWNEGGILSGKREYLRISSGRFLFDISAFPYGRDYYFSWWHGRKPVSISSVVGCLTLLAMPIVFLASLAQFGLIKGTLFFLVAFGAGLFFLGRQAASGSSDFVEALMPIPYIGSMVKKLFKPSTYFAEDSRIAFAEMVERVIQDVIAGILTIKGMSPLTLEQRMPKVPRI